MAIRLIDRYPNRVDPASSDYPHGAIRNKTDPTADDGTPLEQDWGNDWNAFHQALIEAAGITPNGNVDTVPNAQLVDSLIQVAHGVVEIDVGGSSDVTLDYNQSRIAMLRLTGTLAADVDVIVPDTQRAYLVLNDSSGSFDVTVRTELGTGVIVPQGGFSWVRSDGTDVVLIFDTESFNILDEDDMASNSAVAAPSQQSVYVGDSGHRHGQYVVDGFKFTTVQAAIDAIQVNGAGRALAKVHIPGGDRNEKMLANKTSTKYDGYAASRLNFDGSDHTVTVTARDNAFYDLWIDQSAASGDFDAINIQQQKTILHNMWVDFSPRDGIRYTTSNQNRASNIRVLRCNGVAYNIGCNTSLFTNLFHDATGGGSSVIGMLISGLENCLANVELRNAGGDGLQISGDRNQVSGLLSYTAGGNGILITGDENIVSGHVESAGNNGVRIEGAGNVVTVFVGSATATEVQIEGDNNVVMGYIQGDLNFASGSNNNKFIGTVSGSVTDSGTGNTTV